MKGTEDDIGDTLRSENIAANHCRMFRGRKQGALRNNHFDGVQATLIERNILWDEAAQAVEDCRIRDRPRRIEIAPKLRTRAGEIKHRAAIPTVNGDFQHDGAAVIEKILRRK